MMTVKELIDMLSTFDGDMPVVIGVEGYLISDDEEITVNTTPDGNSVLISDNCYYEEYLKEE